MTENDVRRAIRPLRGALIVTPHRHGTGETWEFMRDVKNSGTHETISVKIGEVNTALGVWTPHAGDPVPCKTPERAVELFLATAPPERPKPPKGRRPSAKDPTGTYRGRWAKFRKGPKKLEE